MVTRRWKRRLTIGGKVAGIAIAIVVGVCAVVGGGAKIWGFFFPPKGPDIRAISRTTGNEDALAASFATECMTLYKIGTANERGLLNDCFALPETMSLPQTPKIFITTPLPLSVQEDAQSTANKRLYTVFVFALERTAAGATPRRAYYAMPVSVVNNGPYGLGLPQRVGGPPQGSKVPLGYSVKIDVPDPKKNGEGGAPLAKTLNKFFTAYLASRDPGELSRYITEQAQMGPLDAYKSAYLLDLSADGPINDQPVEGTTRHVLAVVNAVSEQAVSWQMTYPLTIVMRGGNWTVSRLDYVPRIDSESDPVPLRPQAATK